jgi:hypothetical protein
MLNHAAVSTWPLSGPGAVIELFHLSSHDEFASMIVPEPQAPALAAAGLPVCPGATDDKLDFFFVGHK